MEANLIILRTWHSKLGLPALQAKVGPPPGSAWVAVVGAGVVLACTLGAMYWKRARAQPIIRSNPTCHVGKNGSSIGSKDVTIEKLRELLYHICIRTSDTKQPPDLNELFDRCLIEKDKTNALENKILDPTTTGLTEQEYYCGLVLTLALINEKEYAKAKHICDKLQPIVSPVDARPKFLLAVIDEMMAMKKQSPGTPGKSDTRTIRKLIDEAWEEIKDTSFPGFGDDGPPF